MLCPHRFADDFAVDFRRVLDPETFDFARDIHQNLSFTGMSEILHLASMLGSFWEAIWHHLDTFGGMLPDVLLLWGIMQPLWEIIRLPVGLRNLVRPEGVVTHCVLGPYEATNMMA